MELIDKQDAIEAIDDVPMEDEQYKVWLRLGIGNLKPVDAIPVTWLYDLADKKEEEKDIKLSAMIKGVVALWHREQE